jgi:hypothetical protein
MKRNPVSYFRTPKYAAVEWVATSRPTFGPKAVFRRRPSAEITLTLGSRVIWYSPDDAPGLAAWLRAVADAIEPQVGNKSLN